MKRNWLLSATFVALAGIVLDSEAAGEQEFSAGLAKLQQTLRSVPGITSSSASSFSMEPVYYEINRVSPAERPGQTVVKKLSIEGPNFRISERTVSKNGDLQVDSDVAYDGQLFQKLDHVIGSLAVSTKPHGDLYQAGCTPLDQFGFLAGFVSKDGQKIGLDALKSSELWAKVMSSAKFLGSRELDGKKVVSFEIAGAFDPMGNIPCRYEVDLSPDNGFFPVRWAAYTLKGEPFQEFRVKEFAAADFEGAKFFYPKAAAGKQIGVGQYKGQTLVTRTWNTDMFSIGPVDADSFTIDPVSAREVLDLDTQTAISIPK